MRRQPFSFIPVILLVILFPMAARAAEPTPLALSTQKALTVEQGRAAEASVKTTPASAALGIDCGMADMCGIDPCTCGSPDTWGHCACNGTKNAPVSYTVSVDRPGVAKATVVKGKLQVTGIAPGRATIRLTAHLKHYQNAEQAVRVLVNPPNYLLRYGPFVLAAAAASAAAFAISRRGRPHR